MIPGIDISHWQNEIDWAEVRRSGVRFVYIQATKYGERSTELSVSPKLSPSMRAAADNGILWGACHTFAPHIDPVIQAQAFVQSVGEFGQLPPAVRLEQGGQKAGRLNTKARLFMEEVERLTGRKTLIFTTRPFWETVMCAEQNAHTDWARDYPLWIGQTGGMWPGPMYPWAGWQFWTYTDNGRLPGIRTRVNMMWFNGSMEELVAGGEATADGQANPAVNLADEIVESVLEAVRGAGQAHAEQEEDGLGGNDPDEIKFAGGADSYGPERAPKDASWMNEYLFTGKGMDEPVEKMGGLEAGEIEYASQPSRAISEPGAKDASWIDAYLFKK